MGKRDLKVKPKESILASHLTPHASLRSSVSLARSSSVTGAVSSAAAPQARNGSVPGGAPPRPPSEAV